MYGRWEGELWFHRWHMWPVPSSSTPSVAAPSSSFVLIDTNSLSKDGRTIHVGDCALFTPTPHNSLPFVGIIRKLKVGKESDLSLSVNWLYRPADVKLKDGASFEAAPNEVFYSFHKDEIPAASLLHPCKVAFLRKGVELPSGVSSFVCRRVYDIESECLWWLTDRDYINDRQEEVNKLLDKTRIEMYGAVQTQTGGRSPKPLTGQQLKPSSDNVQNSSSSISSHAKSKKREHGIHKSKLDDADSGHLNTTTTTTPTTTTNIIKTEISKITEKGGLVDFTGVEKLIQLMRPEDKKLDLSSRMMLVDVISVTEGFDLLSRFVQIRGLSVLDEWLQEIHKGKIGDSSTKENEKNIEEFLFSLLRALDRLPVNLHALQTCNVGKSVNHLRSHKNQEIQKKARGLVSTWKRRVEAEMTMIETSRGGYKSMMSEVRRSPLKAQQPKVNNSGEPAAKSPPSPAGKPGGGSSEMPSSGTKDGSSTQSPNSQSCSSDHGKISSGVYNSRNSSNGFHGSTNTTPRSQKENLGKIHNFATEKGSPTRHVSDVSVVDDGNNNHLRDVNVDNVTSEKHEKGSGKMGSLEGDKVEKDGMDAKSASVVVPSEKHYEASYSSINALVESCAKFSEASVSPSDDGGMNLLASVAAGEMSRSDVSPECSPPLPEDSCSANVAKLREDNNNDNNNNNIGVANGPHVSGDSKDASFGCEVKTEGNLRPESAIPVVVPPDVKPVGLVEEKRGGDTTKNNVIPSESVILSESVIPVGRSLKVETQINEESASWSSSDMHDDDKKHVQNQSRNSNLEEAQATTSCGDDKKTGIHDSGTSVSEHSNERANDNIGAEVNRVEDPDSGVNLSTRVTEPETSVKLDFDLNEDVLIDDGNQGEVERSCIPGNHVVPSSSSPLNGNRSPLITVPAKGPFYSSENLSRTKSELGWKGSAATSAFRPAVPDNRTNKPVRPFLDFDLNVGVDDSGQNTTGGGLDLDLNASQESPNVVQLPPRAFPSNSSRGFDLNGPGVEESGISESVQFPKKGMQFLSSVPNMRVNNNMDIGVNLSSWFPPNNTYPIPSIPEQSFVPAQRMLSPVLSSTPAVVPFRYSPFPFETNFPLPNAFPPVSTTAYVDAPAGGGPAPASICFPTQAQLVSMPYGPSYFMSLPGGSSNNVGKWGGGGLDLNAGPGGGEDKLAAGSGMRQVADEQIKMFQQMAAGGGKRKEPDGGWADGGGERISYKHPSWQ